MANLTKNRTEIVPQSFATDYTTQLLVFAETLNKLHHLIRWNILIFQIRKGILSMNTLQEVQKILVWLVSWWISRQKQRISF